MSGHVIGTSARPDLPLAVVVGAGALGMAVARRLAPGHRLLLADIDGAAAGERAARMRGEGCDADALACDAASPEAVAALARAVAERGGFRALVYVAGLSPSAADFHAIMRVNLMGAARVCEALLPLAGEGSAAVLISSLAALHIRPAPAVKAILADAAAGDMPARLATALGADATPQLAYPHSKWALNLYARRHAAAWGQRGARIVSLSPGLIATPMGAREFEKSPGKRAMYEKSPIRRECTMLEIADVAEFPVSPRASFINGTDILVDGGLGAVLTES
ncbi:MAG: SDR family oxidoreductase [Novosphingobium sp.]|jgi:NAD(P)-dependent dehydrogenase (short-subunit alcohol dehydrogenase family)|nr:SDR family oxidoreductase [Novosphingobium sp.]